MQDRLASLRSWATHLEEPLTLRLHRSSEIPSFIKHPVESHPPTDIVVEATTGMLVMTLTHLFALKGGLDRREEFESLNVYSVPQDGPKPNGQPLTLVTPENRNINVSAPPLLLVTPEKLDINPSTDHIFLLEGDLPDSFFPDNRSLLTRPIIYMILREQPSSSSNYSLVTTNILLYTDDRGGLETKFQLSRRESLETVQNAESWSLVGCLHIDALTKIRSSVAVAITVFQRNITKIRYQDNETSLQPEVATAYKLDHSAIRAHFEHNFLQPEWHALLPGLRNPEQLPSKILAICQALNEAGTSRHKLFWAGCDDVLEEAYFSCVGNEYQPAIVELEPEKESKLGNYDIYGKFNDSKNKYIQFIFERDEWDTRLQQHYVLQEVLYQNSNSQQSIRKISNSRFFVSFFRWKWKYEGEQRWREADDLVCNPNRGISKLWPWKSHGSERVLVRTSRMNLLHALRRELYDASEALKLIMATYDPPPDRESLLRMFKDGPTKEQESIGTPKYIGSVRIDGSSVRVGIV
ncbi:hypothetical protein N0V90_002555 [Kalmusia sp. IMI 367209]|nr:hypothetical protein N0V90_002555 [Kalmusia sp. IMI 367209]